METLEALSPLDGRYSKQTAILGQYFSETALMRYRVRMEVEYLLALSEAGVLLPVEFTPSERRLLVRLHKDFGLSQAQLIKRLETEGAEGIAKTNHDVKAVEYFIRLKLQNTSLKNCLEWIHFGLTSEDVNNIAYALMLSDAIGSIILPQLVQIHGMMKTLASGYHDLAMLSRTHGQPATPTTFGKEMNIFASRLWRQIEQLKKFRILAKLNGASGNYSAHVAAFPKVHWVEFTQKFITRFNKGRKLRLEPNLLTTQIEPHDTYAELFAILMRANTILVDFCQDMWRYISDDWVVLRAAVGEVGSSTMPHKINPIDWENGEGNLGLANSLFEYFCRKLPVSRLQRDLSDSTVERNFGSALGYCTLAYNSIGKGLSKISPNRRAITQALVHCPEVLTEAIQTILRREGVPDAYGKLKALSRGKEISLKDIEDFIQSLTGISDKAKDELLALTPTSYIGLAGGLASI